MRMISIRLPVRKGTALSMHLNAVGITTAMLPWLSFYFLQDVVLRKLLPYVEKMLASRLSPLTRQLFTVVEVMYLRMV